MSFLDQRLQGTWLHGAQRTSRGLGYMQWT